MPKFMIDSLPVLNAVETARTRIDTNRQSRLERMPNEIKLMITSWIQHSVSIFNLALSGPEFCALIVTHEKKIVLNVITWYIPAEIMHLAVGIHMVTTAPWNVRNAGPITPGRPIPPAYMDSIVDFVEKYRRAEDLTLQKHHPEGLALSQLGRYLNMHNATRHYAKLLATHAKGRVPGNLGLGFEISPTVLFRYMRTLYVMQLVTELFSWRGGDRIIPQRMHLAWGTFWFSFYPWEIEQVFCVQKLLERYIATVVCVQATVQGRINDMKSLISCYVVSQGPSRLWSLEMAEVKAKAKGQQTGPLLATSFRRFLQHPFREFITMGFCAPGFGMKVLMPRIGQRMRSSTFDDVDLGPMKFWYYITLSGEGGEALFPRIAPSLFFDMRALVYSGYALWDEVDPIRLKLPPLSDMHARVAGAVEMAAQKPPLAPTGRVIPLVFRMIEPRQVVGLRRPPPYLPPPNEYCYLTLPEVLSEEAEKARSLPDVGPQPL
ncbi:hypothetical protein F4824DRAFT_509960 [Ustulina deusta]|nr:hypothetical protein F4824DRAFT_509960 [Ustulina deusta]